MMQPDRISVCCAAARSIMCARFDFDLDARERLASYLETLPMFDGDEDSLRALASFRTGDIHPSEKAPALCRKKHDQLSLIYPSWGFQVPGRKQLLINARAESAASKPSFAAAVRDGRCVLPAGAFYEWNKEKEKVTFRKPDSPLLFMAGLMRPSDTGFCFTILTTAANASMDGIHDRMPLLLTGDMVRSWIFEDKKTDAILASVPYPVVHTQNFQQLSIFS